jgi:cytochrome c-type biogenesis protein
MAGLALFLALSAPVAGALSARGSLDLGLALTLTALSANAADSLRGLAAVLPPGYAFAAGLAAAVNPCGVALLPGYLGLYLRGAGGHSGRTSRRLARALAIGASVTASFIALFGAAGFVVSLAGALLAVLLPWASLVIGVLLALAGARVLAGRSLHLAWAERSGARFGQLAQRTDVVGYATYGLAFGFSSLACTLPIFLTVVGTALASGGILGGVIQFALYGIGMGLVLTMLAVAAALFGSAVTRVGRAGRYLESAGAILLLVSGAYVIYYWLTIGGLLV